MKRQPLPSNIVKLIRQNIKAYNRFMTDEYLDKLNFASLLRLTHPSDRPVFALALFRSRHLGEKDYKELTKPWTIPAL